MIALRAGYALTEVIVAGALSTVVLASAAMLLRSQNTLAVNISARSERNDAMRSGLLTLRAELHAVTPATDLRAVTRDSIASRIFRGIAIVCGYRAGNSYVRYEGLRLPDPAKDSALQIGVENAVTITGVTAAADACEQRPNEQVLSISWPISAPVGSMWMIFENGAYHLSTNALRYRRGTESRQPITNEVLRDRQSGFAGVGNPLIRLLQMSLTDRTTGATASDNLLLLNRQ